MVYQAQTDFGTVEDQRQNSNQQTPSGGAGNAAPTISNGSPSTTGGGGATSNGGNGNAPVVSGESASTGSGAKGTGSGRFVNLQQYVNAAAPDVQNYANTIAQNVQAAGNPVNQNIAQASNAFQAQANQNNNWQSGYNDISQIQADPYKFLTGSSFTNPTQSITPTSSTAGSNAPITAAAPTYNAQNIADVTNTENAAYNGPTGLGDISGASNLTNLQNQVSSLKNTASNLGTESGRINALGSMFASPTYTMGQQGLDNAILQSNPNAVNTIQTAAQTTANQANSNLNNQIAQATQYASTLTNQAAADKAAMISAMTGLDDATSTAVANAVTSAQTQQANAANNFANMQVSNADLVRNNATGIIGQSFYGMPYNAGGTGNPADTSVRGNLANMIGPAPTITQQNAIDQATQAKIDALRALSGAPVTSADTTAQQLFSNIGQGNTQAGTYQQGGNFNLGTNSLLNINGGGYGTIGNALAANTANNAQTQQAVNQARYNYDQSLQALTNFASTIPTANSAMLSNMTPDQIASFVNSYRGGTSAPVSNFLGQQAALSTALDTSGMGKLNPDTGQITNKNGAFTVTP